MARSETLERDIAELRSQIPTLRASAATKRAAAEQLVQDEKAAGRNPLLGTSDEDKDSFTRIDAAYKEADTDSELASTYMERLNRLLDDHGASAHEASAGDPRHPEAKRARSMGSLVLASDQYDSLVKSGVLRQEGAAFTFVPVEVASKEQTRILMGGKRPTLFTADAGDGSPLVPSDERLIPPEMMPKREPTLFDMINVSSTGRDAVTWSRQTARTTAGTTTVAFGTALNKSRYQWETVASPVLRKGHYAVADEGNIADQDEFRGIVDGELISDLRLKVESDALSAAGNGTSEWEGIYENASIGSFDSATADNNADAMHKAITTVRVALEREPNAIGISPEDFEDYWLAKGTDGHYLHHRGPQEAQVKSIWGKPAMVSTVFTSPLVGDYKRGATLWVREGITIAISNNVDDYFLEGMFAIRAQTRAAFAVKQPLAFCVVENFES